MGKIVLTDEEKILASRVQDLIQRCESENCPAFSEFLSDRERMIVLEKAKELGMGERVLMYGGYDDSERCIAGFFPEYSLYMEKEELYAQFPLKALEIRCSGFREHSHRDFLGSVLGLGIERSVIGDIIVAEKGYSATMFVHEKICPFLTENLKLVGRDGVSVGAFSDDGAMEITRRFETINGTVASLRADALLSEILNISRDKAVKLIEAGLVAVNHCELGQKSAEISEGDIITVRGSGKFRLSNIGDTNRRGRIRFEIQKYL